MAILKVITSIITLVIFLFEYYLANFFLFIFIEKINNGNLCVIFTLSRLSNNFILHQIRKLKTPLFCFYFSYFNFTFTFNHTFLLIFMLLDIFFLLYLAVGHHIKPNFKISHPEWTIIIKIIKTKTNPLIQKIRSTKTNQDIPN